MCWDGAGILWGLQGLWCKEAPAWHLLSLAAMWVASFFPPGSPVQRLWDLPLAKCCNKGVSSSCTFSTKLKVSAPCKYFATFFFAKAHGERWYCLLENSPSLNLHVIISRSRKCYLICRDHYITDFEISRLSYVIQLGPAYHHTSVTLQKEQI